MNYLFVKKVYFLQMPDINAGCKCMVQMHDHIVRNSFWIKKNRASDNEGKFHTYLKVRIWIWNRKFNFSLDIRVSMNLTFFEKIWFFLITLALATLWQNLSQTYGGPTFVEKNTEEIVLQPDVASTRMNYDQGELGCIVLAYPRSSKT